MAEVREAETYHDASVLHDAVFEANQLCTAIHHAVSDAYFRDVREDQGQGHRPDRDPDGRVPAGARPRPPRALHCLYAAADLPAAAASAPTSPPF